MNILNKIRSLPKKKRKIIFWVIMLIVAIFLFSAYVQYIQKTLKESKGTEFIDQSYFRKIQEKVSEIRQIILDDTRNEK